MYLPIRLEQSKEESTEVSVKPELSAWSVYFGQSVYMHHTKSY